MRELHTAQLASLKAERGQISTDLQRAMGAVKGSAELSEMRELHEQARYLVITPLAEPHSLARLARPYSLAGYTCYLQDTEVIGSRLKALQSEVELAEAELATHEETSTKARAAALSLPLTFEPEPEPCNPSPNPNPNQGARAAPRRGAGPRLACPGPPRAAPAYRGRRHLHTRRLDARGGLWCLPARTEP